MRCLRTCFCWLQGYVGEERTHILALSLITYSATALQCSVPGLFTDHFSFHCWEISGIMQGTGYQIWLLNCIQTLISHSVTSPFRCVPSKDFCSIFSVCCLSGEDAYERCVAQGHALLIAHPTHTHTHLKSEVIHNATVQPCHTHALISARTSAHFLLCLPRDILEEQSFWDRCGEG